ncbi:MAG: septal ring lytic transglycosylase RlpA family protein [Acidobacteriota bacterium]
MDPATHDAAKSPGIPRLLVDPADGGRARTLFAVRLALLVALCLAAVGCATNRFDRPRAGSVQRGVASWYGEPFHGRATASGEIYDMHGLTAAHRELPLGSVVHVTNLDNGREVTVRVNDRGPFIRGRILDLSYGAAKKVGMIGPGTARVEIEVLSIGGGPSGPNMATRFTVQVGAYRERANADALLAELLRVRDDASLVTSGAIHRIRVGDFRRRGDAEKVRKSLRRRGYDAVIITLN